MYVPTCDILKRSFDIPIVSCCPLYNYPDVDFVAVELVSMCWFALQGAMVFSIHRAMFDYAEHVDDASNVTCPYHGWHMRTAMYLMCMYIVHMRFESILKYMSHLIYHLWHIYIYIYLYIYMPHMYLTRVYHSPQRVSWPSSSAPGFGLPRHDGLGTRGPGEDAMERHGLAVPRPNLKRSGGSGKAELTPFPPLSS